LKVLTGGDGGVGKTTLLHRYVEGKFSSETKMTIGVEFFLKELMIDDQKVLLQLWDFGGQERFRFLLKSYVIGARGALLMFDLTRAMSLERIPEWVNICRKENPNLPILFLGSKADLSDDMNISKDYIMSYKEDFNLYDYLEVSSKTGQNVESAFESVTREILKSRTIL
ncbi:MAG: Rab family GTPase, partial [Promethearchaeota archaeon]